LTCISLGFDKALGVRPGKFHEPCRHPG